MRIGINGFGRIGRCVFWALHQRGLADQLEIVRINDTGELNTLRLLAKYDSIHGRFPETLSNTDGGLAVNGRPIQFSQDIEARDIDWSGVDLVMECSGRNPDHRRALAHLQAGAPRVQVGAPAGPEMPLTLIRGLNESQLTAEHTHWSLGSCTTNCLGVTLKALEGLAIESGTYTTIHSYTNDQVLVDQSHRDPRRARSAALSMVPTTTNALHALEWVMPAIAGRIQGYSMRVPTANVSCVDMTLALDQAIDLDTVRQRFVESAQASNGVLAVTDEPLVSIDFTGHPASAIVDLGLLQVTGKLVRIVSWYDNEWGYANRMIDTALQVAEFNQ